MTTTNTDETFIAVAGEIADRVIRWQYERIDHDAEEFFDVEEWAGYHVWVNITYFDIERPSMYSPGVVGTEGVITVTDPEGGVIEFRVTSNKFGDIEY